MLHFHHGRLCRRAPAPPRARRRTRATIWSCAFEQWAAGPQWVVFLGRSRPGEGPLGDGSLTVVDVEVWRHRADPLHPQDRRDRARPRYQRPGQASSRIPRGTPS
eukprot:7441942-Pyramimonas_sp.AAC.1